MSDPVATHTVEEAMVWRNGFTNGKQAERQRIIDIIVKWTTPEQGSANLDEFGTVLIDYIHDSSSK
jgi:hypothetical protein